MAKIGDRITVIFRAGSSVGTLLTDSTFLRPGEEMRVPGVISEDYNDKWLVELDYPIEGRKLVLVSKATQVFR